MAFNKRDKIKLRDALLMAEKRDDSDGWEFYMGCLTDLKLGIMAGKNEGNQHDINKLHKWWRKALKSWAKSNDK